MLEDTKQYKNAFSVKIYKKRREEIRIKTKEDVIKAKWNELIFFSLFHNSNCYQYKLSYTFRFMECNIELLFLYNGFRNVLDTDSSMLRPECIGDFKGSHTLRFYVANGSIS